MSMMSQPKKKTSNLMKPMSSIGNTTKEVSSNVHFISSIIDKSTDLSAEKPKLVIPLTVNNWGGADKSETAHQESADDAQAIAAILNDSKDVKTENKHPIIDKIKPILQSNMVPGLLDIENEDEKFKHDVSLRAENISVHSECYSTIPIANYGEALLRGLGWDGSLGGPEDEKKIEVRPQRLGLGARARPPSPPYKRKSNTDAKKLSDDKREKEWKKEAEKKIKEQNLKVGDIVWLRGAKFINVRQKDVTRARIHRLTGVAGLNQIEVIIEGLAGELVSVTRTDAVLINDEELKEKPFIDKDKKRPRAGNHEEDLSKRHKTPKSWVFKHMRVRIVREGKFHRMKGDVIKVDDGRFTILLSDGCKALGMKESDLESVIPSTGEQVIIVRGEYRKDKGTIVEKNRDKEEVLVEFDSGKKKYFMFDEVTALAPGNSSKHK